MFHVQLTLVLVAAFLDAGSLSVQTLRVPRLVGESWTIANDPDLGPLTDPKQQPVDFAIWQAADGSWQLWSCIRGTKAPGKTRLFHRWESASLTNRNWRSMGIAMQADPAFGETPGGLQAPHVVKIGTGYIPPSSRFDPTFADRGQPAPYHMFYGDWANICVATSSDGKSFLRRLSRDGKTGMFSEGAGNNTRDPMVIQIKGLWYCYYTAYPAQQGAVFCRTSSDTIHWGPAQRVAFGGEAGTNAYSAECPFVVARGDDYYLFRTQRYGQNAITRVYHSRDPLDFGIDADREHMVAALPVAAPEIIHHGGQWYVASLLPDLKGIQVSKLLWR